MTRRYSDATVQTGLSLLYSEFSKILSRFDSESIKAAVAETTDERQAHIAKATKFLETARTLIKTFATDLEETGDEDGETDQEEVADKAEKAVKRLAKSQSRLDRISGTTTAKSGLDDGLPTITTGQLMNTVAGGSNLAIPPDFGTYVAKSAISMSERIESALAQGEINEHEALAADTALQHFNLAKSGNVPMAQFHDYLVRSVPGKVSALFGVQVEPARLKLPA